MSVSVGRQNRIYLNPEPLDRLVALSGLTHQEFAQSCGLTAVTLSRARNGRPVRASTLRSLALGLSRLKALRGLEGLDLIRVTPPIKKNAEATGIAPAIPEGRDAVSPVEA
jgi:transcriptional regulator with XRE-family HTH domain